MRQTKPDGFPDAILVVVRERGKYRRLDFWFDQVAPITGDGIYRRVEDGGLTHHALLINPHAAEHQTRRMSS